MAGPQVTDGQQTLAWATEKLISRTFGDGGEPTVPCHPPPTRGFLIYTKLGGRMFGGPTQKGPPALFT